MRCDPVDPDAGVGGSLRRCPGAQLRWGGREPECCMRCVISGLAEAAAESGEPDATRHSLFNVTPYCGEHFRLWFTSALKANLPRGGAGWSWLDPGHVARETASLLALKGPTGSERGEILLFQAIFTALGPAV